MRDLEEVLLSASQALSSAGFGGEALDLSIEELGTAPQSRSRRRRLRLLTRLRVLACEVYGVEFLRHLDR